MINSFRNEYYFLSNFYPCKVKYYGFWFNSSEAAFQAMKCPERAEEFCILSPSDAKKLGQKVKLRDNWEEIKDFIMKDIVLAKFSQNKNLKQKLFNTVKEELIESNNWGDTYWGSCNGKGQNKLGKILMEVRDKLYIEICF